MAIVILLIYYLYRSRQEEENITLVKLGGYISLGMFTFQINNWMIPLGFIVYYFFFHPKTNKRQKQLAAYIGLMLFFYHFLSPHIQEFLFELPVKVPVGQNNLYSGQFEQNWQSLEEQFDFQNPKMDHVSFIYDKQGNLQRFHLQFIDRMEVQKYIYYSMNYYPKNENFKVERRIIKGNWAQYDRSMTVERFYKYLDEMPLREMHQKATYYGLELDDSWLVNYGGSYNHNFLISGNEMRKLKDSDIPITGYWFRGSSSNQLPKGYSLTEDWLPESYFIEVKK